MSDPGTSAVPSGRVAVAGDWHGRIPWVQSLIPRIHREAPEVACNFHADDF